MVETSTHARGTWLRPRRLLAIAALCLLLGLGLVAAGWFPQERLRLLVEKRIQESIGPRSRVGALHVVPGSLSADLRELTLEGPAYHIEVPQARVRLTLAMLTRGTIDVRTLEATGARITLRPPPETAGATPRPDVRIQSLRLTDAVVTYEDDRLGGPVRIDDVDASGSIGDEGVLVATARGGAWSRQPEVPIGPLSARARVSRALDLDVETFEGVTRKSRVHASGRIQTADPGALDVRWDGALDLAELAGYAPRSLPASGALKAGGTVGGTLDAPIASGAASGEGLRYDVWTLDHAEARFAYETSGARADWLARTLGGTVKGEATLVGERLEAKAVAEGIDTRRLPASVAPASLPPSRVSGRMGAQGPTAGPFQVTFDLKAGGAQAGVTHQVSAQGGGRVDTQRPDVDLRWQGQVALAQPLAPGATGWRSANVTARGDAQGPLPPDIRGTLTGVMDVQTATGPQQVAIDGRLHNKGPAVEADVDARGLGGTAHASLRSEGDVVADLRAQAQGLDVSPFAAGAAGSVDVDVQASGSIDRLDGSASLRAAGLTWQGVSIGAASAALSGRDGQGQATFEVPALNATGEATLDAQGLVGRIELAETPLAPFQPLLPAGRPLEGTVSAGADVALQWRAPERATLTAQVASAEVVSGELAAAATRPFTVGWSDRRARVEGLEAEGEGVYVQVSGSAGLEPSDPIEGRLQIQGDLQQLRPPAPWSVAGTFSMDATLSGTRDAPRADGAIEGADVLVLGASESPLLALGAARAELRGDRIAIADVQGDFAGGTLTVSGEAPIAALLPAPAGAAPSPETIRAQVDLQDVDAEALASSFRTLAVPVQGTLSARLSLEGRPAARELRGTVEAPATTLRVDDIEVELGALTARADGPTVVLDPWTVRSHGGEVVTQGRADLRSRALEGSSRGRLDLRALSPLLEQGALSGDADVDVAVAGTIETPRTTGGVTLADASLRLREIPQAITDIKGRAVLDGRRVRLEDMTAEWGGGTLEVAGTAGLFADEPVDLKLTARDVSLRYPRDFRSRLRADLTLGGRRDALLLSGEVHAERGLYDTDIHLERTLLAPSVPPPPATGSPFLQSIALDLSAVTDRPVLVRNNLAQLEASGRLRIRGDARYPAPFGRLEVREGGKVFLQTREFTIKSGSLVYNGTLDPEIALTAETVLTQVGDEDVHVTAVASGPLERPTLDLRSDPSYTQRELASLIATGRRGVLDSASGTAWAAGEHTAALLAGRFTRSLSRSLRDLGLDEVDIQPELLAREEDPGARFTFGKLLTPQLKLIYSLGLNNPEARFFQAQYRFRVGREVTAKVQREDGGVYSYGLGQRWRWGGDRTGARRRGGRGARTEDTVVLSEVRLAGVPQELETRARTRVRVEPGDSVTFWRLQDEAERVQELLHSAGYLEALVSADLEGTVGDIDARPGARYAWMVEGLTGAPDLTPEIQRAFFEEEAVENGRARLLEEARARGFAKARVQTELRGDEDARTIVFVVTPGQPALIQSVAFPGASALSSGQLLDAAGGEMALLNEPLQARDRIAAAYREAQYLAARVEAPRIRETEDRGAITVEVRIEEGPHAELAEVRFEGVTQDETELGDAARIETGTPYDSVAVEDAVQRIRDLYLKRGFASVRVQPRLEPRDTDLDLVLHVIEGQQQFVGDVVFEGLRRTREATVRRVIPFKKGDPLDPRALTLLERRLLDLDIFRRAAATASEERDATIRVEVREQGPYALQYDVRHNPDEGLSGLVDGEVGNIAGTALALGARYRAGADIREVRGSFHLPALGPAADVTAAVFRQEEDFFLLRETFTGLSTTPDTERQQGFEVQQSRSAPLQWDFLYGYRFKRIESRTRDFEQNVAGVELSLLRETRDNPLDAREGAFLSVSVELGPTFVGSDFAFFRALGQVFLARPLGGSMTWAQGYRLGMANGLDEQLLRQAELFGRSTEAFRAGGAHTLRGYATDSVGPEGPVPGLSRGGEALAIMNQEIRYRHPWGIGVAAFYDVGNVYREIKDLTSFELRHSIGAGLRYESPVGLLRIDFGIPLNKRREDRSFQWFFSLGQAF